MDYTSFCQHYDVSRETYEQLVAYVERLLKWQQTINLISPSTIDVVWERHILDSLQLHSLIDQGMNSILDIGSGGGLPAIPLSIVGGHTITMVESDQRKAIFLQEVIRELGLSTTLINDRIEHIGPKPYDLVIARACASLSKLLEWSAPFLSPTMTCLFPKGENYTMELSEAEKVWRFELSTTPSMTEPKAAIIKLTAIERR